MSINSLHHISLTAPQYIIDKVVSFYCEVLGLHEGDRPDFGIPGSWLYKDNHPLVHLIVLDRPEGNNGYFDHIAFRCSGLKDTVKKLKENKIEYSVLEMKALSQTQLFVADPAGITVELNFFEESL